MYRASGIYLPVGLTLCSSVQGRAALYPLVDCLCEVRREYGWNKYLIMKNAGQGLNPKANYAYAPNI